MKYYVVSDIHGFYSPMKKALEEKGFFDETEPHKLIVCGDMLDRGKQAVETQDFLKDLLDKDRLILIRGNHEDLFVDMVNNFERYQQELAWGYSIHSMNGTFDTALQLSGMNDISAFRNRSEFLEKVKSSAFWKELIPAAVDYYETPNHIFVHGWIPTRSTKALSYEYDPNWRNANELDWAESRWLNGMEVSEVYGVVEEGKRIVCGHWHTSYGHSKLEKDGNEFGKKANLKPFYTKHMIALDACTAHSGFVNCIVIKD